MFSSLRTHAAKRRREPFGKAGLTVAICALVLAMVGGAYAAGGLTKAQEKQVTKIAKKYAGKPGAQGPAGAQGGPGAAGAAGKDGTNGTNGTSGVSPEGTPFSGEKTIASVTCKEGGTEYKGATTNLVCNGKKGKDGETGFTETLPSEKTETGTWSIGPITAAAIPFFSAPLRFTSTAASFAIPLAVELDEEHVHYVKDGETAPEGCTGGTAAEPTAEKGNLCVYGHSEFGLLVVGFANPTTGEKGAGTTGAIVLGITELEGEEMVNWAGTWAVTAP